MLVRERTFDTTFPGARPRLLTAIATRCLAAVRSRAKDHSGEPILQFRGDLNLDFTCLDFESDVLLR